ncbi:MAG TPA: sugar phosphate isomerase/epimerase [Gammaproteobacteria bacterium]|nr:sugar phosphate isomerase/epimerase [Gammaproteobacteria bacterium]
MNKLGIHALVWVGGWTHDECERAVVCTAETGYDFIEIPLLDPTTVDTAFTRRCLDRYRIGATASLGLSPQTDISSEDPAIVARGESLLNDALSAARDFGSEYLCGVIYSAMTKYMAPATQRGIDNALGVLDRLADRARESGMTIGLEVVNRYESNVMNTASQAMKLLERLPADNVVVHLDTYHMNIEESSVSEAVAVCGQRLGYFHIGESHRGYLGSGSIDFDAIYRALAAHGYTGPIAFESFSSAVVDPVLSNVLGVWRNLWDDGNDLATHARTHMVNGLHAARRAVG